MKKDKDHNLWMRDGIWYCRQRVNGIQRVESLNTSDKSEARVLRTEILKKWNRESILGVRERPAVVARVEKQACVSIDALLEAYRVIADARRRLDGQPRKVTVTNNIAAFRRVFGDGTLADVTVARMKAYVEQQLRDVEDEMDLVRARITAASNISQAISVLARWTEQAYADHGLKIGSMDAIRKAVVVKGRQPQYQFTEHRRALRAATEAAAPELAKTDPDLYAVYLLAYMAGLRAGEIVQVRGSWLAQDGFGCWLHVPKSEPGWEVKSKPGTIRLAPQVYEWLQAHRDGREFVLREATRTEREATIARFNAWMRGIGWDADRYPKSAHELRKLAGVRWYTEHGAQTAAKWLRDNLQTVLKYYADFDQERQPDPATPAVEKVA